MRFEPPRQTPAERRLGRRMALVFGAMFLAMTVTPVVFVVIAVRHMPDVVRNSPGLEARPLRLDVRRDAGRILASAQDENGRPLDGVTVRGVGQGAGGAAPLVFRRIQPDLYVAEAPSGDAEITAFLGASVAHAALAATPS